MREKKLVYMFKYHDMGLGGIQRIILYNVKLFLEKGAEVVWIADKKPYIHKGYRQLINRDVIRIVTAEEADAFLERLAGQYDPVVIGMSFSVDSFLTMEDIERKHAAVDFRNYLVIPHYNGRGLFLEENYTATRGRLHGAMRAFYTTLARNGNLLFCNIKQALSFEEHYGFTLEDRDRCLLPSLGMAEEVTEEVIRRRMEKRNIISVCRFDFPHKSYILGLIRAFAQLRGEFSDMKLTLIGYGVDENKVKSEIAKQEPDVQARICVIPGVPSDQLGEYYDEATVFVGLAGAASSAAGRSLVTLIARHYCEDCEVYGSYADGDGMTLREDPGAAVLPELERILRFSEEEYMEESRRTRRVYENYIRPRCKDLVADYPISGRNVLPPELTKTVKQMVRRYRLYNRMKYLKKNIKSPIFTLKRIMKRFC